MSDTDLVLLDRPAPDVARLTLNRPDRRNALSIALRDRFSDLCDELVAEGTVKALIVAGNGAVFSAGFDLKEFAPDDAERSAVLWASADRFHQALLAFPVPTIACVGGAAMAGGFDVATMCDFRVAATNARFARPEFLWGDVLYGVLHDLVGGAVARELTLTPCDLDAHQAHAKGLVTRLVEPDELVAATLDLARSITTAPRPQLVNAKAKVLRRLALGTTETLQM
jgi:enoyl-CoA hydratase